MSEHDTVIDPPRDEALIEAPLGRLLAGRYRLDAVLGSGGFSVVYRAHNTALGRDVAVKILQAEPQHVAQLLARFEREAQALAAMHHPGIVTVTDYGIEHGLTYLVMELVDGDTLRDLIHRREVDPPRALAIVRQVLRALVYAHAKGIIHRDLKPENIVVQRLEDGQDHVRVLDFGFAKFMQGEGSPAQPTLTQKGTAFGTPSYVSPEALTEKPADGRTDVYSTGVILFECLVGHPPFTGDTLEVLRAHLSKTPPMVADLQPDLPFAAEIDPIIQLALAKTPEQRFANAAAMLAALEPIGAVAASRPASVAPPAAAAVPPPPPSISVSGPMKHPSFLAPIPGPSKPMPIALLALIGGGVLFVIVIAVIGAGLFFATDEEEAHPPRRNDYVLVGTKAAPPEVRDDPNAPRDPWAEPEPANLARIHRLVDQRTRLDQDQMNVLFRHVREHPEDPRPHLLLAYAYMNVRWLGAALRRYERAFAADPTCRGDERMERDLREAARNRLVGADATALYQRIYGEPPTGGATHEVRPPDPN